MSLLVKAQREGQTIARVTPETAAWRYVGFAAYRMGTDEVVHVFEPAREVFLTGFRIALYNSSGSIPSLPAFASMTAIRPTRCLFLSRSISSSFLSWMS